MEYYSEVPAHQILNEMSNSNLEYSWLQMNNGLFWVQLNMALIFPPMLEQAYLNI